MNEMNEWKDLRINTLTFPVCITDRWSDNLDA